MAIQNNAPFVRHVGGTEGNTGWDQADVLNAIEQVLGDAGILLCLKNGTVEPTPTE